MTVCGKPSPSVEMKTDSSGLARHSWPADQPQIVVVAPGIGYGATGTFDIEIGQVSRPELPPLVPSGTIDGTLPEEFLGKETTVGLNGWGWLVPSTVSDVEGHFVLRDVPAGNYWVMAGTKDPKSLDPFAEVAVAVTPGQRLFGVKPSISKRVSIPYLPPPAGQRGKGSESVVWAEGTVRDETGQPIDGAEVIARGEYFGGLRDYELVYSALTDADGHWQIVGKSQLAMFRGFLIAHKIGYPHVIAELRDPSAGAIAKASTVRAATAIPGVEETEDMRDQQKKPVSKPSENPQYEFVLPADGGRLDVLVTEHGKPVADAHGSLALARAGARALFTHLRRLRSFNCPRTSRSRAPSDVHDGSDRAGTFRRPARRFVFNAGQRQRRVWNLRSPFRSLGSRRRKFEPQSGHRDSARTTANVSRRACPRRQCRARRAPTARWKSDG